MKKHRLTLLLILILLIGIVTSAYAHSGRTDSSGGHYNRSTGEYHYHHGMGPHQHPNGICPYSNSTGNSNNSTYSSSTSVSGSSVKTKLEERLEQEFQTTPEPSQSIEERIAAAKASAAQKEAEKLEEYLEKVKKRAEQLEKQYTTDLNVSVYIPPNGKLYHTGLCDFINLSTASLLTLKEALATDYEPHEKCAPPILDPFADGYSELKAEIEAAREELSIEPVPEPTVDISNEYNDNGFAAIPLITFGGIPLAMFTYYTCKEKKQRKQHQEEERQRQYEERRAALVAQYEGKSISDLANVPRQYLNKDEAPDIKVCISKDGTKYHKPTCRYARGPQISIAYAVGKSPCGVCKPGPCPLWLKEYRRISADAAQYNIKMLP